MRRIIIVCTVLLACCAAGPQLASGQGYPGGGMPGGRGGMQSAPGDEIPNTPAPEKPDKAAKKAFQAGVKSLNRAREYTDIAAKAANPDKKADALDKVNDAYGRALDQFTEALSNKGDMVEAWNNVGYIHLQLGAYGEAIDDYNHTLALDPNLLEAVEHRAEAHMAVDRLDDAQAAYMSLFNHSRPLADQLMVTMHKWLESHRVAAHGMRPKDIEAFGKWLDERETIAKQTAANPQ